MSQVALRADSLGKRYRIGQSERYLALRDVLARSFRAPWRLLRHAAGYPSNHRPEFIWALKDISLEVGEGEVVGIIGRNGAGKTTLLKILARVTRPTEGYAEVRGRLGSLLEVGTGFHPELTGRENVFLSGAILGMSKREIERKFDEIVDFAEIEKFLDTPVKHYSSGMFMRLAFAVAAHLEPDILLVDEVLAVGDAAFQKKCLGKMGDVARGGRTVLFVSHNMGAITRLCPRSVWIDEGKLLLEGPSTEVVSHYQSRFLTTQAEWTRPGGVETVSDFAFLRVFLKNLKSQPDRFFAGDEAVSVEIHYSVGRPLSACQVGTRIYNSEGLVVLTTTDADGSGTSALPKEPGLYRAEFTIPGGLLAPGTYYILLAAHMPHRHQYDLVEQALVFEISSAGSLVSLDDRQGVVTPMIYWQTTKEVHT